MHFLLKLTVFIYAHKVAPPSTLYYDTPVQIWRMIKVLISHKHFFYPQKSWVSRAHSKPT